MVKAYSDWKYALKIESKQDDDNYDVVLDDVYIAYTGFKPVDITVGRWGMGFGLEDSTSSSWITAIERPFILGFMEGDGGNNYALQLSSMAENYTLKASVLNFEAEADENEQTLGYAFCGTVAPIMSDDMLLHLGFSMFDRNPDMANVDGDGRIGLKKGDKTFLFNDLTNVTDDREYAFEAAMQMNSMRLQGEYFMRDIESDNVNSDVELSGYYGQISYMLDGGKRSYKKGSFGKPKSGKWEVFARYSSMEVDADSSATKGINGKDVEASSYTLGVNHFPTKNIRTSLNYVSGQVDNQVDIETTANADDKGNALVGRIQYVF